MKRERIALGLLIVLIVASFLNIAYMDKLAENIISGINSIEVLTKSEQFEEAEALFNKTLKLWNDNKVYTGIFLRHPEIDSSYDYFYDILSEIQRRESTDMNALCEKLKYHISCIAEMERIGLRSIL